MNGNLTAVHEKFESEGPERHQPSIREGAYDGADLKDWSTNFPEKILVTTVETPQSALELWNVRAVPRNGWGEEKVKILETATNASGRRHGPRACSPATSMPQRQNGRMAQPFRGSPTIRTQILIGGQLPRPISWAVSSRKEWSTCSATSTATVT